MSESGNRLVGWPPGRGTVTVPLAIGSFTQAYMELGAKDKCVHTALYWTSTRPPEIEYLVVCILDLGLGDADFEMQIAGDVTTPWCVPV